MAAPPTLLLQIDQADNGLSALVTDVTVGWSDITNTGVTSVIITMSYPSSTVYTVINATMSQPCPQSSLIWKIPSTAVGYGTNSPFLDNIYTINVTYSSSIYSSAITPVNAQIYFDWNAKLYDFQQVQNLPYFIDNSSFAFLKDIQDNMLFFTLLRGAQYNASVGQVTKVNDIINIIAKYALINIERKGFNYYDWELQQLYKGNGSPNQPYFAGYTPPS